MTDWAAALTYYGLLSLFPALIALVSILGLVADPVETTESLTDIVTEIGPDTAADTFQGPIESITSNQSAAGVLLIVGLATALWSASGYIGAFIRAANVIWETPEGRGFFKLRPLQLGVTLAMVLMLALVAISLVLTGPVVDAVGDAIGIGSTATMIWDIAKWPVLVAVLILMIGILYHAAPNVKMPGFRWVTVGGIGRARRLDHRLGAVRVLRRELRLLRQDLRRAGWLDLPARLVLDQQPGAALRPRAQRRARAQSRDGRRRCPEPRRRSSSSRASRRRTSGPPDLPTGTCAYRLGYLQHGSRAEQTARTQKREKNFEQALCDRGGRRHLRLHDDLVPGCDRSRLRGHLAEHHPLGSVRRGTRAHEPARRQAARDAPGGDVRRTDAALRSSLRERPDDLLQVGGARRPRHRRAGHAGDDPRSSGDPDHARHLQRAARDLLDPHRRRLRGRLDRRRGSRPAAARRPATTLASPPSTPPASARSASSPRCRTSSPASRPRQVVAKQTKELKKAGKEGKARPRRHRQLRRAASTTTSSSTAPSVAPFTRNDIFALNALKGQFLGQGGGDEARRSQFLGGLQQRLGKKKGMKRLQRPSPVQERRRADDDRRALPLRRDPEEGSRKRRPATPTATSGRRRWHSALSSQRAVAPQPDAGVEHADGHR